MFRRSDELESRAWSRLGVGIDMALRLADRVRVSHGGVLAEYRRREAPSMRDDGGHQPGTVLVTIEYPRERPSSLAQLPGQVRHCRIPIDLDGRLLSQHPRDWFAPQRGVGSGFVFEAGLEQDGLRASTIELWSMGVCVDELAGEGRSFRAVLELDHARRDLARAHVIRDDTIEDALVQIEDARQRAFAELREADERWTGPNRPAQWPATRVDAMLDGTPRAATLPAVRQGAVPEAQDRMDLQPRIRARVPGGELRAVASTTVGTIGLLCVAYGTILGIFTQGLLSLLLGLVAFTGAVWLRRPLRRKASHALQIRDYGIRTTAKIVGITQVAVSPSDEPIGELLWTFVDQTGARQTGRSLPREMVTLDQWPRDQAISIYYDRDNPDDSWWDADVGPRQT